MLWPCLTPMPCAGTPSPATPPVGRRLHDYLLMIVTLHALRLCDTVPARLTPMPTPAPTQLPVLHVHSAFRHACNLRDDRGRWLTLQTRTMPLAPRGIIVDVETFDAFFAPGQAVRVLNPTQFQTPRLTLDLAGAEHCDTRLVTVPDDAGWQILAAQLPLFLSQQPPAQGLWHALIAPPSAENRRLKDALDGLSCWLAGDTSNPANLGGAIQTLLGYGAGLTPSGDDFLVGLLATLGARNRTHPDLRHSALCDALRSRLVRTTDFGAALLANACDGHYDESLRRLLTLPADLPQALAEVAAHGHSSGHDTLCGMAWALPRLL